MNMGHAPHFIQAQEVGPHMTWSEAIKALRTGHLRARATQSDVFLGPAQGSLLSRAAHIEGLGFGVKSVTVFGDNPRAGLPTVQGAMQVFEPEHGRLVAIIDSRLITEWKTAADSVLGAQLLARADSETLLIVGAGAVARSLVHAYAAGLPSLRKIGVWARRPEQARALVAEVSAQNPPPGVALSAVLDLATGAARADIIASATMAREPILLGEWVKAGTHVDLIGAFKADMREADDALISAGRLFVDSRESTMHHIGELCIPLAQGVIEEADVLGDLYDLCAEERRGGQARCSRQDITIFKNGGGAHLDLMMAGYIAEVASHRSA
jgi:ornithine cyclodeaminase